MGNEKQKALKKNTEMPTERHRNVDRKTQKNRNCDSREVWRRLHMAGMDTRGEGEKALSDPQDLANPRWRTNTDTIIPIRNTSGNFSTSRRDRCKSPGEPKLVEIRLNKTHS